MKLTPVLLTLQLTAAILLAQSSPQTGDKKWTFAGGLQTDLSGSHFHLVSLANAQFGECDLSKTTFRSIKLGGASITSTDLTGAVIRSCNLSNAEISASNLSGMKIDGVLVTDLQKAYAEAKKKR
jgi:uncharacterized protein YjbI with pentapeptide repeats